MSDRRPKKAQPLGRILLQRKLITQNELDNALGAQDQPGKPLASRLIDQGVLKELDAVRALSEQHGVPGIDLSQIAVDVEHLLLPREVAEAHKLLPVLVKDDKLFVAMADPGDTKAIDELEFVTGKKVYAYVALASPLLRSIAAAYDAKGQGERFYLAPNVPHETLVRLGLAGEEARAQHSEPPPPIVDSQTLRSAERVEVTTDAFGNVGSDVSSVTQLPADMQEQLAAAGASDVTAHSSALSVLVVDDEADIRKLLRRLLEGKGMRVLEADRGLLALRMVKEHAPDLIILDAMLPELHGFDIARRIKGSKLYGQIPIVMISAVYRGWRIAQDMKESYGIEEYVEKPFRLADVLAAVQRALAKRGGEAPAPATSPEASGEAEAALAQGIEAYRAGRIDDAIAHMQRGVAIDPLAFRLRFHLGLLYGKKGALYEAIHELEKAVELSPSTFPALKNLAVLYEKAGFRNKAVEAWERATAAAPDTETREQIKAHLLGLL